MIPVNQDHDERFNAALSAFLDDEEAGIPEADVTAPVSLAYQATERAIAEAESHPFCAPDGRPAGAIIQVVGSDGRDAYPVIPVGVSIQCVVGALVQDEDVVSVRPVGLEPEDKPEPEPEPEVTEAGGMRVTSEVPGLVATHTPEDPAKRRRWWQHPRRP